MDWMAKYLLHFITLWYPFLHFHFSKSFMKRLNNFILDFPWSTKQREVSWFAEDLLDGNVPSFGSRRHWWNGKVCWRAVRLSQDSAALGLANNCSMCSTGLSTFYFDLLCIMGSYVASKHAEVLYFSLYRSMRCINQIYKTPDVFLLQS